MITCECLINETRGRVAGGRERGAGGRTFSGDGSVIRRGRVPAPGGGPCTEEAVYEGAMTDPLQHPGAFLVGVKGQRGDPDTGVFVAPPGTGKTGGSARRRPRWRTYDYVDHRVRRRSATAFAPPRGCGEDLAELLGSHGATLRVDDRRVEGRAIEASFHGELTPVQQDAAWERTPCRHRHHGLSPETLEQLARGP